MRRKLQPEDIEEIARLCSRDIGKEVPAVVVNRWFAIGYWRLGDPMWAFEDYNTEDAGDIVATIIKEADRITNE